MPQIGDPAPTFHGVDILTGDTFSLNAHQGKRVLVAFHALTWCPPCQFAVPLLQEVWEEIESQGGSDIEFVVVSVNEPDLDAAALQSLGITMPWLKESVIADLYEVGTSVPQYFFLDGDHKICEIEVGLFSTDPEGQKQGIRDALARCAPDEGPFIPRDFVAVAQILFGVVHDGEGVVISGGKPRPVPPWDPLRRLGAERRDLLVALAVSQLGRGLTDGKARAAVERAGLESIQAVTEKLLSDLEGGH